MRIVVDTNVVISALLKPGSVPDRALATMAAVGAIPVYDARIEAEYREVSTRRKFRSVPEPRRVALLSTLLERGVCLVDVPAFSGEMIDADDRMFVEVARAGADALCTGNLKHFSPGLGFALLSPAELLERLESPAT